MSKLIDFEKWKVALAFQQGLRHSAYRPARIKNGSLYCKSNKVKNAPVHRHKSGWAQTSSGEKQINILEHQVHRKAWHGLKPLSSHLPIKLSSKWLWWILPHGYNLHTIVLLQERDLTAVTSGLGCSKTYARNLLIHCRWDTEALLGTEHVP